MEPPICDVCDERFDPGGGSRRVRFVPTDAGRRFAERVERDGIVGDPPDEGWFCSRHAVAAEALSTTHTRPDALRELRDPAPDSAVAAARARLEHRRRTRVDHPIPPTPRGDVAAAMRRTLDEALRRLGLVGVKPVTSSETSTSPSPEWRESATTTTIDTRETWASDDHEVGYRYRDTVWDAWSGVPRRGDLFQGTIALTIDDTWLFASFGPDGLVSSLDESGHRTPTVAPLLDDLIAELRRGA